MKGARVLLLAAGHGRRAGGPKAWLDHGGKPLLQQHVEFFGRRLGESSLSVAIQSDWLDRCRALSGATTWITADPEAYPLDSLQRLIKASPLVRSFVLHVDMPAFDVSVYETLWNESSDAVVPVFDGHRGHPVLLSPSALTEMTKLDSKSDRLDVWLRTKHVLEVPVSTDVIFKNLNEKPA